MRCRVSAHRVPSRARRTRPRKLPYTLTCQGKAHQKLIREREAAAHPRRTVPLARCVVEPVTLEEATALVVRYEYLGTMPPFPLAAYGLRASNGELLGVEVFGRGPNVRAAHFCGPDNAHLAVCVERGTCVHHAHRHAGSFLLSRACKLAAAAHGWRAFYAYSDPLAGEIGTIYQACNWLYLGVGAGAASSIEWVYVSPEGRRYNDRALRRAREPFGDALAWERLRRLGWRREKVADKGKYVHFEGDRRERKRLMAALKVPTLPYPKRA